jgi:hypothetical protein
MSRNRLIAIFAVLVLLVAAAFTIGSGIAPAPLASNANDYLGRHPELVNSRINVEPMDYFQRHPESLNPSNAVDLSDYYARHLTTGLAIDQRFPGKEQDDMVTSGRAMDRRFPGKEKDDLVTTGQ